MFNAGAHLLEVFQTVHALSHCAQQVLSLESRFLNIERLDNHEIGGAASIVFLVWICLSFGTTRLGHA